MEQVLFAGSYDDLHATVTIYGPLMGGVEWQGSEAYALNPIGSSGIIKKLRVKLDASPGAGKSYAFTLMVDGSPSALTLTISNAETSGANTVNEVTVSVGQTLSIRCIPSGTPTPRYFTMTTIFEGDTANESLLMGGGGPLDLSATQYGQIMGALDNFSATENDHRQVCPTSGTIKNLYVELSTDPGTAPDAYKFTVRLNGATVAESLIVTITANDKTGNDTTHNLVVTAGDILTMKIEPLNSPSSTPASKWGMTFVADTDGESILLGGSSDDLNNGATEYALLIGEATDEPLWTANENECYQLGQTCTLKKLYVLLSAAPGAGNKYTFTVRIAGASSNVVAEVADAATTGNSSALTDTVANDDYVDLQVVPTSTPTVRDAYWGLVSLIAVPVAYERSLSTAIGLAISLSRATTYARSLTTATGLTATLAKIHSHVRGLTTSIGLTTTLSRAMTYGRSLSVATGLVASLSRATTYARSLSTSMGLSVSLSRGATYVRSLTTSIGTSATLGRVQSHIRSLSTSIGLTASLAVQGGYARSLTTAIGLVTSLTSRYWGNRIIGRVGDNRTISSIGTNRDIQGVGTNRDISGIGTNRDISTVGDNRDVESF